MRFPALTVAVALLGTTIPLSPARCATHVFGRSGETLSVLTGAYSTLFPGGTAAASTDPVLALEVRNTLSGAAQRILVPGTGDARLELSPSIVFESTSERAFLVWEERTNSIHSQILIGSYGADGWSDPIEVNNGSSYALKGSPQVVVSRDRFTESVAEQTTQHSRTIVHVIWWQEVGASTHSFYAPVIIVDGHATSAVATFDLSALDASIAPSGGAALASALQRHPVLLQGRDERRAVAAFVGERTGTIVGIELEALPREITNLADRARAHIVDLATAPNAPSRSELAERLRLFVLSQGAGFHPVVAAVASEQLAALVLDAPASESTSSLAERARAHIVDLLESPTLGGFALAGDASLETLYETADPRDANLPAHLFAVRSLHSWPMPTNLPEAAFPVISRDAAAVAIAWPCLEGGAVCFIEHGSEGWSATQSLPLQDLSLSDVAALVRERLDRR